MVELNSSVNGCTASPTAPRDALGLFAVVLGAITTVAGVLLPWVTLFNGLSSVNGMGADGFYLLGIGTAALLLIALFLRTGRPAPLRRLALFLALVVTTVGLFDAWRIVHFSMAPGVLRPLAMPQVGPGSFVAATGGLLLAAGMLTLKPGASRLPAGTWPRLALAGSLGSAAWIHFAIIGEHLGQTLLLGLGTAAFGIIQASLAVLMIARPRQGYLQAAIVTNAALIFFYAYNVVVGLPFAKAELFSPGLLIGHGEAVGLRGAAALSLELIGLAVAMRLSTVARGATSAEVRAW